MLSGIKSKNKSGISIMVGYVLLVTLAIVMGIIAYNWMKTYVPSDITECPEGASILIKEATFNLSNSKLVLTLKNNGRFNLVGYLIYGANSSGGALQTIDLSRYLNETYGGKKLGNAVSFFLIGPGNSLEPSAEVIHVFDIPSEIGRIYSTSITPMRIEEENNKEKITNCGNARTSQSVGEPGVACISESLSTTCGTFICGNKINNCGYSVSCGTCTSPNVCNSNGVCVAPAQCTDTCATYLPPKVCGTWDICGVSTVCGSLEGLCSTGFECNSTGQCVALPICGDGIVNGLDVCDSGANCQIDCTCPTGYIPDENGGCTTYGNGICDTGETCDESSCDGLKASCLVGQYCSGGICIDGIPSTIIDCSDYCVYLGGYSGGTCRQNDAQCLKYYQVPIGNLYPEYCTTSLTQICCCTPS